MNRFILIVLILTSLCACQDNVLYKNGQYTLYTDHVKQNSSYSVAVSPTEIRSQYHEYDFVWNKKNDITGYPMLSSPFLIEEAIYNMAVDEMVNAVEKDSTLRTGKEWAGVWTRDVSYSIILSMAYMQTEVSKKSLMRKVNTLGRIIQDTGTGGAWPCSSDRMIWAVAAWEIYKVTGDMKWLRDVYPIIKNSMEDDLITIYDEKTGLVNGESSFIDWREQSYPIWMEPVDIYTSKCLGTNAVHYETLKVLGSMAFLLEKYDDSNRYKTISEKLKVSINKWLWMGDRKYYAQYMYGRNFQCLSPKSETLGEALSILFGVASHEQSVEITENAPLLPFGSPIFYPEIPDIPPYHNNAVWPFVSSFWALASAQAENEAAVLHSLASIYRAAALFATNKENFVAQDGDFSHTQINSSNMLWSLSGCISLTHKLLFGLRFEANNIEFHPFVPKAFAAHRTLTGFKLRDMILDIDVYGYGNRIKQFLLDGKEHEAFISSSLKGNHHVSIILENNDISSKSINMQEICFTPATPDVSIANENTMTWNSVENALSYLILKNGKTVASTRECSYAIPDEEHGEYQVIAIGKNGVESFASEPLMLYESVLYPISNGAVRISRNKNRTVSVHISVPEIGMYSIDWLYANGNGPINTENKCCIRTLLIDDLYAGVSVFPHRGKNEWNLTGWSNSVHVSLSPGFHTVTLKFLPANENMNIDINEAILYKLRLTKMTDKKAVVSHIGK